MDEIAISTPHRNTQRRDWGGEGGGRRVGRIFNGQTSIRAMRKIRTVTAARGQPLPQTNLQSVAGLLGKNSISDEEGNGPT
ncbi:hypothetical protein EVAR_17121_1 [Eumeta japonica]|uniref:Uncharacterized protein n=1 Tax=Eumeta variegata TaxID=151549 RepID=A0A4C1UM77_EUMVA|nr:hypothetical protein EVAR_17121_1 [Eumeta japonica]